MSARLEGKVAVITGAASGIGAATTKLFIEEGAFVVLADIQVAPGEALASALGPSARFVACDVTKEADVAHAVNFAVTQFGKLDILLNNAGIVGAVGPIAETSAEAWNSTINVLLNAAFYGIKHAARVMIPRHEGCILSIASTAGIMAGLGPHAYTAAKFGVVGLSRSAASELAGSGIRVNIVAPGTIATEMILNLRPEQTSTMDQVRERIAQGSPLSIAAEPSDIANALLFLASPEARYITGHTLVVDAGQTAFTGRITPMHTQAPDVIREAGRRGI